MRNYLIWLAVLIVIVGILLAGCDTPTEFDNFDFGGRWENTEQVELPYKLAFVALLTEGSDTVEGSATIVAGADTVKGDVKGTYDDGRLTLRITPAAANYEAFEIVSESRVEGWENFQGTVTYPDTSVSVLFEAKDTPFFVR